MRVASVPSGHVYVRHLSDPELTGWYAPENFGPHSDSATNNTANPAASPTRTPGPDRHDVYRLPDPDGKQWPSALLRPGWINANADNFDVFHVHFGFDALSTADLEGIVSELRAHNKPLVYTVHDLRNPHHVDRTAHDEALDVLIPAATELITLTPGAAAEIKERWGREATVLPHPHIVDPQTLLAPRPTRERLQVGVHLKSLRASMNPIPVVKILLDEAPSRGIDLVIDCHTDVITPGEYNYDADVTEFLAELENTPGVRVHIHDYYSDADLYAYFMSLDLSVLPYRFGTHSGWLEACFDVGTHVLAPRLGYYHDQHEGIFGYRVTNDIPDAGDIAAALNALPSVPPWRADPHFRWQERRMLAEQHARIYQRAVETLA